jgi:hypothetical protein
MYYTTTGLSSLPEYQGGGYLDQYGRQQYGLGKLVKKITKPIANVLDKIIPNEIKPALPYLAAFAPFMFPGFTAGLGSMLGGSGTIGGLSIPNMIGSGVLKAGADLSQEGAAQRGLNPLSLGATMISAGLAAPGSTEAVGNSRILGNLGDKAITLGDIAANPEFAGADLSQPTTLQNAQNLLNSGLTTAAKYAEVPGATVDNPMGGVTPFSGNPGDFTAAAKKLAIPGTMAASEQAAIKAGELLDEYNSKLGNIKNMTQADLAERRKYVQQYMSLAGFGQSDIDSALSRQGLMMGGRAAYEAGSNNEGVKTIPINLDAIAKQLFGDRLDNLTYTQKESVYNRYYDLKNKKAKGGLMSLGGNEMDFRAAGGFVPIGKKERADDVPARLSKNEFVFTAKAVRNAGGGDIKHGAKKMYQLMKQLEAKS